MNFTELSRALPASPRTALVVCPKYTDLRMAGADPNCLAESKIGRELELFAAAVGDRGDRTCRVLPVSRAAERRLPHLSVLS
jgi:hypothetical protein